MSMLYLGMWFNGRLGNAKLIVALNDLWGLFQSKGFYDSFLDLSEMTEITANNIYSRIESSS